MALMSLSQYAKSRKARGLIGGTLQAVQDAIRTGRVGQDEDGMVEQEVADREWRERTNRSIGRPAHQKVGKVPMTVASEVEDAGGPKPLPTVPIVTNPANGHHKSYGEDDHPLVLKIQADYRLKLAKAEEAELKNAERKGLLLSAAVVKEQNVRQAKAIRDHMLSFASRRSGDIAAELGVRERLTYEVLDKSVRAHLAEISKELEVAE